MIKEHDDWTIAYLHNDYVINFCVYAVVGWEMDGTKLYERLDTLVSCDLTADINQAQKALEGSIKWDGCSNINFCPNDGGYQHFCGRSGVRKLAAMLDSVYELGADLFTNKLEDEFE